MAYHINSLAYKDMKIKFKYLEREIVITLAKSNKS